MPDVAVARLFEIRNVILAAAEATQTGPLTETLKWGQPAYLTEATKSGTTIRLGLAKGDPQSVALFVHCQSSLVERWRSVFSDALTFEGNRAVIVPVDGPLPEAALHQIAAAALTYHRDKRA